MATEKARTTVYFSPEIMARIEAQAKKMSMSKSAVIQLAVQAGMKSIEMATDPDWQAYFEKMIREDPAIKIPKVNL